MGGDLLACDASPHSPWSIVSSRKSGVGAGLLAHHAAHIAELFKTTSSNLNHNKNTRFQYGEMVIGLFVFVMVPFQKILAPGKMTVLGTLGGRYE